jgi:hypothetical protein
MVFGNWWRNLFWQLDKSEAKGTVSHQFSPFDFSTNFVFIHLGQKQYEKSLGENPNELQTKSECFVD